MAAAVLRIQKNTSSQTKLREENKKCQESAKESDKLLMKVFGAINGVNRTLNKDKLQSLSNEINTCILLHAQFGL